eukprot:s2653_g11.t2
MREEDIGAVADLFDEFVEDHRERCDEEVSDPAVWYTALGVPHGPGNRAKRILQRWLDHDKHFVMVSEVLPMGKVTGFVHMQAKEEKGKETLTVEHLKVSNKHEKKGVGRMLLAHAEKQAEEMALNASSLVMMTLLCVSSNSRAKNFYQQAGWKPSHSCNCSCGRCPEDWLLNSWVCPEIWRDGEDPCDADVTFLAMQKQVRFAENPAVGWAHAGPLQPPGKILRTLGCGDVTRCGMPCCQVQRSHRLWSNLMA